MWRVQLLTELMLNFNVKLSNSLESRERAIVLPCKLVESLSCQSSDCKQVLSQLQENLPCSEASLDNPDVGTKELIRRFTREAKYFGRLDVVQHLRGITPAGTTGEKIVG